jgi:ABC-type phosphate transport system substrate-binding protein
MKTTATLVCIAALASGIARADVVVIVNPKNPLASLTAEQVGQIYTGATSAFPNGAAAVPLDQPEGAVRDEFLAKVVGKSAQQVKAIWSRLIFSGKGTKPKVLDSSADVKRQVAADANAIGFIEKSAADATVKTVLEAR